MRPRIGISLALAVGLFCVTPVGAAERFDSLDAAFGALVTAIRGGDTAALMRILGPEAKALVSSGDAVADRTGRELFAKAYDDAHRLEAGGGRIVLVVGKEEFPFPIPLVPDRDKWRFDTRAGREEILNRRVGRNELSVVQVCLAYADAQREYYARNPDGDKVLQYAQQIASTPGRRNGLFWEAKPGEAPSPLGDLVGRARGEGYAPGKGGRPSPYHGYYYRILKAQGPHARGGAHSYVANGKMIGGFALVAFPARYGASGVMTFLVNHDGVVYEKDLGPSTAALARRMTAFDPDDTWKPVK
jgi:hypothetical protein